MRDLTRNEQLILEKLLSVEFNSRDAIKAQAQSCKAKDTDDSDGYGSIYLFTDSTEKITNSARVPVEGELVDEDGVPISVLLHVVDGKIHELEIFKQDGSSILRPIDPAALRVVVN